MLLRIPGEADLGTGIEPIARLDIDGRRTLRVEEWALSGVVFRPSAFAADSAYDG